MIQRASRLGGPIPKFNDYHVWKAVECLDDSVPVGRKRLAQLLGIGEGSTRTILSILQDHGLITIGKSGILLTDRGKDFKQLYHMDGSELEISDITIGDRDYAVRVPKRAKDIRYGSEERDAAIKSGATGATTLVVSGGKLIFPGSDYPVEPDVAKKVVERFDLKNDDVVIIGTGPSVEIAEIGAVTAGLTIMGGLHFDSDIKNIFTPRNTSNELVSLAFAIHDLVGGLPVCAKSRDNLGIRIENGAVIDNAYNGPVLDEVMEAGVTIRRISPSGPYKGIRVIVTPIEMENRVVAVVGVVDIRTMAGINNLIRLRSDEDE